MYLDEEVLGKENQLCVLLKKNMEKLDKRSVKSNKQRDQTNFRLCTCSFLGEANWNEEWPHKFVTQALCENTLIEIRRITIIGNEQQHTNAEMPRIMF